MKTDDLVAALAAAAVPVDPARADRRFLLRLALGGLLALGLMLLFLGPRPDLASAANLPMFWVKLGLPPAFACRDAPGAATGATPPPRPRPAARASPRTS
ncbi:MAG: DUF1109 family protein, partial [Comamonadaceae bacterium]